VSLLSNSSTNPLIVDSPAAVASPLCISATASALIPEAVIQSAGIAGNPVSVLVAYSQTSCADAPEPAEIFSMAVIRATSVSFDQPEPLIAVSVASKARLLTSALKLFALSVLASVPVTFSLSKYPARTAVSRVSKSSTYPLTIARAAAVANPVCILVTASAFIPAAVTQSVGIVGRLVRLVTVGMVTPVCVG